MPDYMAVDYPDAKILRESITIANDSQESLTMPGDRYRESPDLSNTISILSGHRGWVTVDRET